MIQGFQSYLTKFIDWLDSSRELSVIRAFNRSIEDEELDRLCRHMKHLNGMLRSYINRINNILCEYEQSVDHAYSQIKRKQRFLKVSNPIQNDLIKENLNIATSRDAIIVAKRLKSSIVRAKVKQKQNSNAIIPPIILIDSETLCDVVLAVHRDIPAFLNEITEPRELKDQEVKE